MQLLAMAICQIETTGIEPVSHDIEYHCSTTELYSIIAGDGLEPPFPWI